MAEKFQPNSKKTLSHLKHLKLQYQNRQLTQVTVELINANDHDSLAFLARNTGVPPQLRYLVWPILLKYHPMCISPNILSNTVTWDRGSDTYQLNKTDENKTNDKREKQPKEKNNEQNIDNNKKDGDYDSSRRALELEILHDLKKYFHIRSKSKTEENDSQINDDFQNIELLKDAILSFLIKWSKIFTYEPGLAWIAVGIAEWFPLSPEETEDGPILLNVKKHVIKSSNNEEENREGLSSSMQNLAVDDTCFGAPVSASNKGTQDNICNTMRLFKTYPLPGRLRSQLPPTNIFNFNQVYERFLLVILHSPDTVLAQKGVKSMLEKKNYEDNHIDDSNGNYFPLMSGGDLAFQTQMFFRVFASILPELYQPLTEETSFQQISSSRSWLYWWLKCSGARALQKQDRARVWDMLLGWRPNPDMNTINYFLNYNTKKFDHLYSKSFLSNAKFLKSVAKNDPFWFPDLYEIPVGSKEFPYDYNVFKEVFIKNRFGDNSGENRDDKKSEIKEGEEDNRIPFSLIDPHVQLIFVFIAILQHSEFKLLEFEETDITEFLNNVPLLSKADDTSFKKMCEYNNAVDANKLEEESSMIRPTSMSSSFSVSSSTSSTTSASSSSTTLQLSQQNPLNQSSTNMMIEVGNDGKTSSSFNNIITTAGDIWRKWLWNELEDISSNDLFNFDE